MPEVTEYEVLFSSHCQRHSGLCDSKEIHMTHSATRFLNDWSARLDAMLFDVILWIAGA
jgi:hypothetical protein